MSAPSFNALLPVEDWRLDGSLYWASHNTKDDHRHRLALALAKARRRDPDNATIEGGHWCAGANDWPQWLHAADQMLAGRDVLVLP